MNSPDGSIRAALVDSVGTSFSRGTHPSSASFSMEAIPSWLDSIADDHRCNTNPKYYRNMKSMMSHRFQMSEWYPMESRCANLIAQVTKQGKECIWLSHHLLCLCQALRELPAWPFRRHSLRKTQEHDYPRQGREGCSWLVPVHRMLHPPSG